MSNASFSNAWIVEIDGADRRVSVETDEATGRTQIRIDGRMAARPLNAHENERRFTVGNVAYVLRREDSGLFVLDLDGDAQPVPNVPTTKGEPQTSKPRRGHTRKIVAVLVTLLMLPLVNWAFDAVRYMRVPWQVHAGAANQFRVSFPTVPEEERSKAENFRTTKLSSRFHDHLYVLEWIDFPFRIPPGRRRDVVTRALDAMIKAEGARVVARDLAPEGGRDAAHFILEMPENTSWSGGTARGHVVAFNNRVYIQYAYVPRGESLSYDVGEYLRSLELPHDN